MGKLFANLQLVWVIAISLLDITEVCEKDECNEVVIKRTANITYFVEVVIMGLRNKVDDYLCSCEGLRKKFNYFKVKILSGNINRFSDINYIECLLC